MPALGPRAAFRLHFLSLCSFSLFFLARSASFFTSFSSSLCSSARFPSISRSVFLSVHLCFPFSLPRSLAPSQFPPPSSSLIPPFFVFVSVKNKRRMNLLSLSCFAVTVSCILKSKFKRWGIFFFGRLWKQNKLRQRGMLILNCSSCPSNDLLFRRSTKLTETFLNHLFYNIGGLRFPSAFTDSLPLPDASSSA